MSSLSQALGRPKPIQWKGEEIEVEPFDLNDIADIEEAIEGSIESLNPAQAKHQKIIIWIVFRRLDSRLTDEMRNRCEYRMTLEDAGRLIKIKDLKTPAFSLFLIAVCRNAGLLASEEDAPKKQEAPAESEAQTTGEESSPS